MPKNTPENVPVSVPGDLDREIDKLRHDIGILDEWIKSGNVDRLGEYGASPFIPIFHLVLQFWEKFRDGNVDTPYMIRLSGDRNENLEAIKRLTRLRAKLVEANGVTETRAIGENSSGSVNSRGGMSGGLLGVIDDLMAIRSKHIDD